MLEIAFRTAFLFVFTLAGLRFIGQRSVSQLSAFELGLIIALGSAVGDPMFYPDVPLVHGMIVITVVLAIHRGITALTNQNRKAEKIIEGKVRRIIVDGEIDPMGVQHSQLSLEEILMKIRHHGIKHLSDIHRAYLETDGEISIIEAHDHANPSAHCILPDDPDYDDIFREYHENITRIKQS